WCGSLGDLSQTEIQNLHAPVAREHHVVRLEIAMHNTGVMGRGQAVSNLDRNVQRFAKPEFRAAQRLAVNQLADDVGNAAFAEPGHGRHCGWLTYIISNYLTLTAVFRRFCCYCGERTDGRVGVLTHLYCKLCKCDTGQYLEFSFLVSQSPRACLRPTRLEAVD